MSAFIDDAARKAVNRKPTLRTSLWSLVVNLATTVTLTLAAYEASGALWVAAVALAALYGFRVGLGVVLAFALMSRHLQEMQT